MISTTGRAKVVRTGRTWSCRYIRKASTAREMTMLSTVVWVWVAVAASMAPV